jgi:small subunit ribosomal protein S2
MIERIPDAVFLIDMKMEKTALREAQTMRVPVVALCDTNVNPLDVAYPIPANDDAVKGIDMMTRLIAEAVKEGKAEAEKVRLEAGPVAASPVAAKEENVNV